MKILLLNPHVDAAHGIVKGLEGRGVALLLPANVTEAWQMLRLHGTSVDLAVVHREGFGVGNEPGLQLVSQIKADEVQSDLPLILTSEKWSEADCAAHQKTPQGANAYLLHPFTEPQLFKLIQAVLEPQAETPEAPIALASQAAPPAPPKSPPRAPSGGGNGGMVLEDASAIFAKPELSEDSSPSILLEAPEQPARDPSLESGIEIGPEPQVEVTGVTRVASAANLDAMLESSFSVADESEQEEIVMALPEAPAAAEVSIEVTAPAHEEAPGTDDALLAQELPYLFSGDKAEKPTVSANTAAIESAAAAMVAQQPLGDAVVPGGAVHSPDLETLKKYLLLREQDVAALSTQLKSAKEQLGKVEEFLRTEKGINAELTHILEDQKRKIDDFEKEKASALQGLQNEINELKFESRAKADKVRVMESKVRDATSEMDKLKERVRSDIRKIRVREKELENRLEIMKKDSEVLIAARENKIVELKRKLDLLEFNMDLLQDQYVREKENTQKLKDRLKRAAQVVRVAGGLLDSNGNPVSPDMADETGGSGEDLREEAS